MPKIKLPPPKGILDHLVKRYREGRISSSDFLELWFKRFRTGFLAGNSENVSTFLEPGMAVEGVEVQ